ncbi:PucR family transcriptional regulator [Desulfotomaculum copahuensis]|uniref:PucR C-terminal helix-turn-helix domain-containing protein n=1 Tax=Desulfotomaculum copahuensis TaxID=1838280 RepID=A0A1B7LG64_9FIRM|nr:helix-turn-helix domain-containing protein [Desulfotomaculum copahuensis]OAT84826.1 hypothetical protein A6M21_07325 [Desulfotomaculum copahuensis]
MISIGSWEELFIRAGAAGDPGQLVADIAALLGGRIIIADAGFVVVASYPVAAVNTGRLLPLPAGAASLPAADVLAGSMRLASTDSPYCLARAVVKGRTEGFLLRFDSGVPAGVEKERFLAAAALVGLVLAGNRSGEEAARGARSQFLFDLLYNNLESREALIEQGRIWGWDFSRPHALTLFVLKDFAPLADQQLMQNACARVSFLAAAPRPILLQRGNQIVYIRPLDEPGADRAGSTPETFARHVLARLAGYFPGRRFIAGIGNVYPSPSDLFRSYQEAKLAVELGPVRNPARDVFTFAQLGVIRLIHDLQADRLEEFQREMLEPLFKYDQANGTELVSTLHSFFNSGGRLKEAAGQMFLHPNTLRYRLKKVEELLGASLDDLETCLNLFAALKAGALLEHREKNR